MRRYSSFHRLPSTSSLIYSCVTVQDVIQSQNERLETALALNNYPNPNILDAHHSYYSTRRLYSGYNSAAIKSYTRHPCATKTPQKGTTWHKLYWLDFNAILWDQPAPQPLSTKNHSSLPLKSQGREGEKNGNFATSIMLVNAIDCDENIRRQHVPSRSR